jgi:NTP-dependent ternary system trypsin peptidase co-occuring protein
MKNPLTKQTPMWQTLLLVTISCAGTWFYSRPSGMLRGASGVRLGIEDLVNRLRGELEQMEVDRVAAGKSALFEVKNFDLELAFVIKESEKQSGKIEYEVVTAEMEREVGREQTHKIILHLDLVPPQAIRSTTPTVNLNLDGAEELPALKRRSK